MSRTLHNHIIIILLFINLIILLTGIPWVLNYYRLGHVWPSAPSFCISWLFVDEVLYIITTVLFAWATIERHILIFYEQRVSTKKKFILLHCFPPGILIVYCLGYNLIVIIFPPCENTFDYTELGCGYPLCYYEVATLAVWDVVAHDIIPTVIIISFSLALLIRVLHQKSRMRQPIRWRKYRKMTIQLLSISVMYLILYIPSLLLEFAHRCGVSEDVGADFMLYSKFFSYYGNLLFLFVCAGSLPDLKNQNQEHTSMLATA